MPSAKLKELTPQATVLQHPAGDQATRGKQGYGALYESAASAGPADLEEAPAPPFDLFSRAADRPVRNLCKEARKQCAKQRANRFGILSSYPVNRIQGLNARGFSSSGQGRS